MSMCQPQEDILLKKGRGQTKFQVFQNKRNLFQQNRNRRTQEIRQHRGKNEIDSKESIRQAPQPTENTGCRNGVTTSCQRSRQVRRKAKLTQTRTKPPLSRGVMQTCCLLVPEEHYLV